MDRSSIHMPELPAAAPRKRSRKAAALPERGIGRLLRQCYRAFAFGLQKQLAPYKVTTSQWLHLRALWEEDGLSQGEISRRIGIEKASSTSVLDSLEQRKFIRRARNKSDRRKTNVFLTPAGRALKATLLPCAVAMTAQARQGLSPEEVITFLRVLETMIENLLPPERHRQRQGALDSLEL
jgi:DNA-binding MarR family transcriptional regulator